MHEKVCENQDFCMQLGQPHAVAYMGHMQKKKSKIKNKIAKKIYAVPSLLATRVLSFMGGGARLIAH